MPLSMSGFADALTMFVGKPVGDETSLKGDYLFRLDIHADTMYATNQNMFRANPLPAPGGGGGGQRGGRGGGGGGPATAPGQGPPAPAQGLRQCIRAATEQAAATDGNISMLFQAVQTLGLAARPRSDRHRRRQSPGKNTDQELIRVITTYF